MGTIKQILKCFFKTILGIFIVIGGFFIIAYIPAGFLRKEFGFEGIPGWHDEWHEKLFEVWFGLLFIWSITILLATAFGPQTLPEEQPEN